MSKLCAIKKIAKLEHQETCTVNKYSKTVNFNFKANTNVEFDCYHQIILATLAERSVYCGRINIILQNRFLISPSWYPTKIQIYIFKLGIQSIVLLLLLRHEGNCTHRNYEKD
jgi:hypothetical protein